MGQQSSNQISETRIKALEIQQLYQQLETSLAKPGRVLDVGDAYRQLLTWCKEIRRPNNEVLSGVLEVLSHEEGFPAWRRQALEEAYRIFYDEAADLALEELPKLPEPPTSEDIGFRPLSEELLNGQAVQQEIYEGSFTDSSLLFRRRWDYEIHRIQQTGVTPSGRKIVAKVAMSRYFDAAGEVAGKAIQALLPVKECCSAREDARAAKGPFLLPKGARGQRSGPSEASQEGRPKPVPKMEPLHFDDHDVVKPRARLSFPQPRG
ncbi:unnamed protein product [Cladocopium goreaui]|uniref:Uncharacterized protein n=1 Tax=Cladocopium goreaui TaxID=2562237 RepID=A0A9P1BV47_9DINO|nr:unnamed protein product [Cladocopium goreaui]